jgi:hypothetical protein
MGLFKKTPPPTTYDDIKLREFWSWFSGYLNTILEVVRDIKADRPDLNKLNEIAETVKAHVRTAFGTEEQIDYKIMGDIEESPWSMLMIYSQNNNLKNAVKRMGELIPETMKGKWSVSSEKAR